MNIPPTNKPKRNRTLEEVQQEEEAIKQAEENKKKQKQPRNAKLPNLFPRLNLKPSVKYALVGIVVLLMLMVLNRYQSNTICKALVFNVISNENNAFLNEEQLKKIITEGYVKPIVGVKMNMIELKKVEDVLKASPYIENAQVSKSFRSTLNIEVKLREPIARVMNSDGTSLYIDKDGLKFPTAYRHSSNVLLLRGSFSEGLAPADSFSCELIPQMLPVVKYINADKFWNVQISEIYINPAGELTFYPQVGTMFVEFGNAKNIEEKFANLKLFYDQVIKEIGWSKYRGVSVKYKGQVVGKR